MCKLWKVRFTLEITGSEACKRRFFGRVRCWHFGAFTLLYLSANDPKKGGGARFIRKSEKAIKKGTSKEKKESSE